MCKVGKTVNLGLFAELHITLQASLMFVENRQNTGKNSLPMSAAWLLIYHSTHIGAKVDTNVSNEITNRTFKPFSICGNTRRTDEYVCPDDYDFVARI